MQPYYQDDWCTIYHGESAEILADLPPCDMILTDPAYGETHTHAKHLASVTLRNGETARQPLPFAGISAHDLLSHALQWTTLARRWVIFTCEWQYMHLLDAHGLLVRFGIWRKPNGAPQFTGDRPGMGWEALAICHRPGKKFWHGGGKHAVYSYPKTTETGHPNEKPVALYHALLTDFSCRDEQIIDPFMGSGACLRAAKDLRRHAIGIELDERWCEMAAKRLAQEVLPLTFV